MFEASNALGWLIILVWTVYICWEIAYSLWYVTLPVETV
jgi:hypothetical protein